jgi:hypothetical protein
MATLLILSFLVLCTTLVTVIIALAVALVQFLRGRSPRTPLVTALIAAATFAFTVVLVVSATSWAGGSAGAGQYLP